jgi:hypothetical protein
MNLQKTQKTAAVSSVGQKFLTEQWASVYATTQRLGLTPEELLDVAASRGSASGAEEEDR